MDKIHLVFKTLLIHKFKFVLMILSALVFAFFLFPFDDLGDLVTAQVAKLTGNQVYLLFDRMNVGVMDPGLQLSNVYLETSSMPPLSAQEITVTPSVMSLINKKPAGSVSAKGLFKGSVEISLKPGGKSENGIEKQKIQLTAQKLALADLRELASLPMALKGQLSVTSSATADLAFQEQPDMDISLKVDRFELPSGNVNTMMGPLALPELKLASLELKGRLSAGRFQIEDCSIGKEGDELRGSIKGGVALQLKYSDAAGLNPLLGAYDFTIDLNIKKGLQDRAALFLSFLDQYKTVTTDGAHFQFRVSATSPFMPPNISALR
jgi:type II secretion system protein N